MSKRSFLPAVLFFIFCCPLVSCAADKSQPDKATSDKPAAKDDIYEQVELFADAVSALREGYVENVNSKKLMYGAMKGMLSSLDDYSQFMDPDEYKEMQVETKGEFGGIGVEISMRDGIITVVTPLAGTPAEEAGIKPGDKVVKIDGKTTKNMTLEESVKAMRGRPGTVVGLTIWRDRDLFDLSIKRDIIHVQSIKKSEVLEDRIGYIKLVEFQENTAQDLDRSLKELESKGIDSLILDLRNNPGGLLDGSIDVSERFLAKDRTIVSIKARDPKESREFKSSGRFTREGYPMIVMVNEGSASASEIVAGAVKDNKRGIVLGGKTFGKASVQSVIPLADGSALRFTTALYLTPSGRLIKGEGIIPDIVVKREYATMEEDGSEEIFEYLERDERPSPQKAPKDTGKKRGPDGMRSGIKVPDKVVPEKDNQLEAAVNLMKAIKIYKAGKI